MRAPAQVHLGSSGPRRSIRSHPEKDLPPQEMRGLFRKKDGQTDKGGSPSGPKDKAGSIATKP